MLDKASAKLEERVEQITQIKNLIKPDYRAKIKVRNQVFAGVKVIISDASRFINYDNKYSYVTLQYGKNELKILPFD